MPTYEYRCRECGADFEKFQRMADEPVAECPKCGVRAERRMSAGAGLLFKGSGFYITDYRSEGYKQAARAEKPDGGSGESKASGDSKASAESRGSGGSKGSSESKPSPSPPAKTGTGSE